MLAYQEKQRLSFERADELARLLDVRPPSSEGNADAYLEVDRFRMFAPSGTIDLAVNLLWALTAG